MIKGSLPYRTGSQRRRVISIRKKEALKLISLKVSYCLSDIGHKKLLLSKYHTAVLLNRYVYVTP